MPFSFPEYNQSSSLQDNLYIVVHLPPGADGNHLAAQLDALAGCGSVEVLAEHETVLVQADPAADADILLLQAEQVIENYNQQHQDKKAEIIEARICSQSVTSETDPFRLSDRFLVSPAGFTECCDDDHVLIIDHGRSFGSGKHPSTRLAVKALEDLAANDPFPKRALDVGCGSGILSLVAARLGAESVLGVDISTEAVAAAKKNADLNQLADSVRITNEPLETRTESFDLIMANLSPSVLMGIIPQLGALLAPGGKIVLSGMQTGQLDDLRKVLFKAHISGSWRTYVEDPWRALLG